MTTYNTYQEAKIANPDEEILTDCKKVKFTAELGLNYYHKCNPSDYCMTVEKFLADGYKFVEGDLILDEDSVYLVTDYKTQNYWYEIESANKPDCDDGRRHTLRAAALEDNPSHKVEPTIESAQAYLDVLSQACSELSCDVGHLLINIKGLMKTNKEYASAIASHGVNKEKPRTKVEYVKVNGNYNGGAFWECAKDYSDGVIFTTMGSSEQLVVDSIDELLDRYKWNNLYRRVETPITEREAFVDWFESIHEVYVSSEGYDHGQLGEFLFDNGCKLVN